MGKLPVSAGKSNHADAFKAGRRAVSEALDKHTGTPEVLMVFGSSSFDHEQLLAGVISVSGQTPMVGGTTAGEISASGFSADSVAVIALSSDTLDFVTAVGLDMRKDEGACARALAEAVRLADSQKKPFSAVIFSDGMGGDGVKVISSKQFDPFQAGALKS